MPSAGELVSIKCIEELGELVSAATRPMLADDPCGAGAAATTRRHYPGEHVLELQVNGTRHGRARFTVTGTTPF